MRLPLLYFLSSAVGYVYAEGDPRNHFIRPSAPGPTEFFGDNLNFSAGSTQRIQWTTTLDNYSIILYQHYSHPSFDFDLQTVYFSSNNKSEAVGEQSFNWKVQADEVNLTASSIFLFWLNPGPQGFKSHYFNILQETPSSSTQSSLTSTVTSSLPNSISLPVNNGPGRRGLRIGLGVGLGLGIPLILIAIAFIVITVVKKRRSLSKEADLNIPLSSTDPSIHPKESQPPVAELSHQDHSIHEAPESGPTHSEMPTERPVFELSSDPISLATANNNSGSHI